MCVCVCVCVCVWTHTHAIYSEWQTLIVSLNFTKIINLFLKSDWLITMLFQGQQRCWSRNMSHLIKSGSAWRDTPPSIVTHTLNLCSALIHLKCTHTQHWTHTRSSGWPFMMHHSGSSWGFGVLLKGISVVVLKEERELYIHSPHRQSLPDLRLELTTFWLWVLLSNHYATASP